MPIQMFCTHCHGSNIKCDAWAEWNVKDQDWYLSDYDTSNAWCEDCEGETSLCEEDI